MKITNSICNALYDATLFTWDFFLTLGNLVRSNRPVGGVIPEGHPGYGGYWPEYRPPQEGDRIIARSGRGIKFTELPRLLRATYNFSPSFCYYVCHYTARMLNKSYTGDTFDLEEISLHNRIEHDASLTRLDACLQPNQAVAHPPFIEELFTFATGTDPAGYTLLTIKDLSRVMGKRRAESKATNKTYALHLAHKFFASANASTMITIFGGQVGDLRAVLLEERLPQGWESRVRRPYGLTMFTFNLIILTTELGVREADWAVDIEPAVGDASQASGEEA